MTGLLRFSLLHSFRPGSQQEGESLREIRAVEYTCGLSVTIVGLGLYSYYVRELLASLALFAGAFFILGVVAFGIVLVWCAGEKVAKWTPLASRSVISLSRRLIAAHARQ